MRHAVPVRMKLQIESLRVHFCGLFGTDHVQNPLFPDVAVVDAQALAEVYEEVLLGGCCPAACLGRLIDALERSGTITLRFEPHIQGRVIES